MLPLVKRIYTVGRVQGRHVLLTLAGRPFFSLGVVHIGAYAVGDTLGLFQAKYGEDWGRLAAKAAADLHDWGFNTAGYHSPVEIGALMPFMRDTYLADIAYWMGRPRYPDVFSPGFREQIERSVQRMCAAHVQNANLIGYYWTDTPRWDLDAAREGGGEDWVSHHRALGPEAPGKHRYVAFLLDTHGNDPGAFRAAYGVELDEATLVDARFGELELTHPVVARDDRAFLRLIAREYYRVSGEVQREADPNHLVFGDRYLAGDRPDEVIEEALPWIDILSVQPTHQEFEAERLDHLHTVSGKPILICDHQSSFYTQQYPRTLWDQYPSEAAAGSAYAAYLAAVVERPYLIGYHRCQYIDRFEPALGILKQGLLREDETPYHTLVEAVRRTNFRTLARFNAQIMRAANAPYELTSNKDDLNAHPGSL